MDLTQYVNETIEKNSKNGVIKISSGINKRWEERVVAQGLHNQGSAGAGMYLERYGKNIAAPKVIDLALCAQSKGFLEMANVFWAKAFELTFGEKPKDVDESILKEVTATATVIDKPSIQVDGLPDDMQPGKIITMQPVDAPADREMYIKNPEYIGQPKRDGHRMIIIATPDNVYYQSRSTNLTSKPNLHMHERLMALAKQIGEFVLDGELWHRAADGSEHRTAAQAVECNIVAGIPTSPVKTIYSIFKAMLKDGKDLRSVREETRIKEGMLIADLLNDPSFEMIPVAYTEQEKRDLVKKQQAEGREGEIWVQKGCKYKGGKDTKTYPIVRTKYLEEINAICTGVTNTTAEGRLFGAMIVAEEIGGEMVELGRVGTGFSYEQQVQIMDKLNKGPFPVKIISQGRTTAGKVWHGRFDGFIN